MLVVDKADIARMRYMVNKKNIQSVVVEAAHVYINGSGVKHAEQGALLGASLSEQFCAFGCRVTQQLFVDDYNVSTNGFELNDHIIMLARVGFSPDQIVYEQELVAEAEILITQLKKAGLVMETGNDQYLQRSSIALRRNDRLSCPLLDTVLYMRKLADHDAALTVLPLRDQRQSYPKQQKATRSILRSLNIDPNIINVYFCPDTREIRVGVPHV